MIMNLFEYATRNGLRFEGDKGLYSVEDLWNLTLTALDKLAVQLNNQITASSKVSFVSPKSIKDKELELVQYKFDIVLHIINVKVQERDEAKLKAEKAKVKQQLLSLKYEKEQDVLKGMSMEEIEQKLKELE